MKKILSPLFKHLFWKIFFWYWSAMVAMVLSLITLLAYVEDPNKFFPQRERFAKELENYGNRLKNRPFLKQWKKQTPRWQHQRSPPPNFPPNLHLFDSQGQYIGHQYKREAVRRFYLKTRKRKKYSIESEKGLLLIGPYPIKTEKEEFLVYLTQPNHMVRRFWRIISYQWALFAIILAVSGIFCLLLTQYLVSPIRQLQKATKQIAQGDFSALVNKKVTQRKDEIGELGEDFNTMSLKLDSLVGAQKRLLRDISHELRSPLTRLQIALALAQKKSGNLALHEHDRIELEIGRLDHLIGQVVEHARLDYQAKKEISNSINLLELLEQIVQDANFEAESEGKHVILSQQDPCEMIGNSTILRSAIENIIRNAIRFTPSRPPPGRPPAENQAVEVFLINEKLTSPTIKILVEDQGQGVEEKNLDLLFEPFFREDETRGQKNGGSGLGMAIAKRAIEIHKGTIRAENKNPGLRVIIELPTEQ